MKKLTKALVLGGVLGLFASTHGAAVAAVSAEEAGKLGSTLTPVGAEKAGNKEGTIPEYTGGLTAAPSGFDKARGVRPDPFADEKPQFSIDAKSIDKQADKLTEGTKALMKAHPDFRIDVYPTHRSAAYPKWVLDNAVKNATGARLSDDGLSLYGARPGVPFPIPKNGNQVMFNYLTSYQGATVVLPKYAAYNVDAAGKAVLSTQGNYQQDMPYFDSAKAEESGVLVRSRVNYTGPARRMGEAILSIDPLDFTKDESRAWQYLPGQRRVRLAPDIGYDTPNSSTGGMSTYDDVQMFNGKQDRFDFRLVGKKEMYVPYNDYRLVYQEKQEEALGPKFIKPENVRWELHRVWVVDAKLKEGKRHIYSRRVFYIDEDSWSILASDQYDARGQLWRSGFAYLTQNYDAAAPNVFMHGHYDLLAGTYYVNMWPGAGGMTVSDKLQPDAAWSPDNLAGRGVR